MCGSRCFRISSKDLLRVLRCSASPRQILRVSGVSPDIPVWFEAGSKEYGVAGTPTLFFIQMLLFA